ncbi:MULTISPECIES: NADH:ubiquinone reductase (Na(+)-transporting) subunit B [unclassified Aureispira]|uniref:NADH:ubiquinone reductase (Na(+)-transporting) subunit B n=1 Tax=unclassified Aureispira TaxID=2649989 RepID=UPI00069718E5|nr:MULTISPECIES: NADH:ubiquinone reductase (Na(+)-transporting) subunit B [unclassified Aureispira]WMX16655.1 NADH:ubiquinone reductase (Na(+)-transporting) subunit B [Aureispira sp. CCB-E]
MGLFDVEFWKKIEPSKDKKFAHGLYDGVFTLFFKPNEVNHTGTHIKGPMDLKRLMIHVVIALQACYLIGSYNIGHQHFLALGEHTGVLDAVHLKLVIGLMSILPLFIVSNLVGLAIEFYFASQKGHPIEEGYLVTGALIPLIMPPDVPLWMLTLSIIFAVLLAKEAFGGTGMNVVNIALMARAFIFFAYPTEISGDAPWVSAIDFNNGVTDYSFLHTMFNGLFESLGWSTFINGQPLLESFTGATPLVLARTGGWEAVTEVYSSTAMFVGGIPGCVGETSKLAIILGIAILLVTRVASWRIMFSMALGVAVTGMLFNVWGFNAYMDVPWYNHFLMGGLMFALAFMATDPVTACGTNTGKWIYGFLIGFFGMVIRVMNPAYAEGWMLAILLMNVFAPTIDFYVVDANINRRLKRAKAE